MMRDADRRDGPAARRSRRGHLSFLLLALLAAAASAQTPDQQKQIENLLDKALQAPTVAEAEASIAEAQSRLDSAAAPGKSILVAVYLQGEIVRARGKIHLAAWQQDKSDDGLRQQAEKALSDAYQQYKQAVDLIREQQTAKQGGKFVRPLVTGSNQQLEEYGLRLQYALAWTEYELGLAAADPLQRRRRFTDSIRRFVSHFTATAYRPEPVLAHCFLGQALCLFELGEYSEVIELLKPAQVNNTRLDIYQQMVELRIRCYQQMNNHKMAKQIAWDYLQSRPAAGREAADWRIALSCARTLDTLAATEPDSQRQAEYRSSLETLARDFESAGDPWRSAMDAILKELKGDSPLICLSRARSRFADKDYAAALAEAQQGVATASRPAESQDATLADLRFISTAALWELERWQEAHRQAAAFLKDHPADARVDKVGRCALQAGMNALKAEPPMEISEFMRFVESATTTLAATKPADTRPVPATLPAQILAAEAAWYGAGILLDRGRYPEAERLLEIVPASSPLYLRAQYGLALAGWKRMQSKTAAASRPERGYDPAASTLAALVRCFQTARQGIQDEDQAIVDRAADLVVLVADYLVERGRPDPKLAALLDEIESLPKGKSQDITRRLVLRVEIAILTAGPDPGSLIVQFISQKRPTAADLAGVLKEINRAIDRRRRGLVARRQNDEAAQLADTLLNVHRRLLSQVADSRVAQVREHEPAVRGQLARLLVESGRYAEAMTHYEWLQKNVSAGLSVEETRGFALACENTGKRESAIGIWSRLARSLPPQTDEWYEARYHLIDCYHRAGQSDHARNLLDYFLLQNPEIKLESWRQKFDELKQVLPKRPESPGGKG